jgi:hypothetical protein
LTLPHTKPLIEHFKQVRDILAGLEPLKDDVPKLIDQIFPDGVEAVSELRELALSLVDEANDADELFTAMMKEITQPDIPPEVKEVRVMSLHKSKGLSSPYVFIAQCVQGVLPQIAKHGTPKAIADAALEESRRLMFVGITRVKAGDGHVGKGNAREHRQAARHPIHKGQLRTGSAQTQPVHPGTGSGGTGANHRNGVRGGRIRFNRFFLDNLDKNDREN